LLDLTEALKGREERPVYRSKQRQQSEAVGKWEADKSKPSVENLLKLCDTYETDLYELLEDVSNINFSKAKFKGHTYASCTNFTINNTTPPELIESIIANQNKISVLVELQNELFVSLLAKNK
jgi:transcriptional regulator with XRE-family HTH domain